MISFEDRWRQIALPALLSIAMPGAVLGPPQAAASVAVTATPVFSLPGGTYSGAQSVAISTTSANAQIYYTTNGQAPTIASTRYTGSIAVVSSVTIKAIAVGHGCLQSVVAAQTYTIIPLAASPAFSLAPGAYSSIQSVSLTDATAGASIFYTTNGSPATPSSSPYTGPIQIWASTTINTIAIASGYTQSAQASAAYTIALPAAAPIPMPQPGTYSSAQTIRLVEPTPGATVYYTVDGTTPTSSSARYTQPITVTSTETVSAIAVAPGYSRSAVVSAAYIVMTPAQPPTFLPAAGTYTSAQSITLSDATTGAAIYYTTDGSAPTTSSQRYVAPISMAANGAIRAIAVVPGSTPSTLAIASYTIALPTPSPTFSVSAGTYIVAQTVAITDSATNTAIYYTTNGTQPNLASARYSQPIAVATNETVSAIAVAPGYSTSPVSTASYVIAPLAATPVLMPAAGTYVQAQQVSISDSIPGTVIYYTLDRTVPSTSSQQYVGPITVASNETINAIAIAPNYSQSATASASYAITPPAATPVISAPSGTYISAQTISIADSTPGVSIFYTTDGSLPTQNSLQYEGPVSVAVTETLKAIAIAPGYSQSGITAATYTITPPAATPVITPPGGLYTSPQAVTIASSTPGAIIYYTVNGSSPTTSSPKYSTPIAVSATSVINAMAVAPGYSQSSGTSAVFTILPPVAISTPGTLPPAHVGAPYNATVLAAGEGSSYVWTVNGTSVPSNGVPVTLANGLVAANSGNSALNISGTPQTAGTLTFTASAAYSQSVGQSAITTFSVVIYSASTLALPSPTPSPLPAALAGASYQGFLTASGGVPPYSWTLAGLPATMATSTSTPITTVAGNGIAGYEGDGGSATQAEIMDGGGIVADQAGNVYFADTTSSCVRMVSAGGTISTIAGTGVAGYNGDNIAAAGAQLNYPVGLALDRAGNLYIADSGNARIRMVSAQTGLIATVAGTGTFGFNGDGLAATSTLLNAPLAVVVDAGGDLLIADSSNFRVREVSATNGEVTTIAGTGKTAFAGDGGAANLAQLRYPAALAIDPSSDLFILDLTGVRGASTTGGRIREVFATSGVINTVAGNGVTGFNGDNIAAPEAQLAAPMGIALDGRGNLYIADTGNNRVRAVNPGTGIITTIAGTGASGFNGDSIAAVSANVSNPQSVATDSSGNVYAADGSGRIREVQAPALANDLAISGTPQSAGTISLLAQVQDATGAIAGPVSYSINVASPQPLALPIPNPITLPSAVVNQGYSGSIVVAGGIPSYTWWVNANQLRSGVPLVLSNGLTVSANGTNTLVIGGTPTVVGVVSFRAIVEDRVGHVTSTITYSIDVVSVSGYQVGGQVNFANCGGLAAQGIVLTVNTIPAQVVSTSSTGAYSFANLPNGTYTVTPSGSAPQSIFYPPSQTVVVSGGNPAPINFTAELGYDVNGSVSYVPGVSGRVYVNLINTSCPGMTMGTNAAGSGPFSIRGVQPGTYQLQAWVDELGYGKPNASDATAASQIITIGSASVGGVVANPVQPALPVLTAAPTILHGGGYGGGVLLGYQPIVDNNGVEQATSYTLEWCASSSFNTSVGTHTFAASGVSPSNLWILNGLATGGVYYFRAQGKAGSSAGPWSNAFGPITIGASKSGNSVSGVVTFSGSATGQLYLGFRDQSSGKDYIYANGQPVSPQSYSALVPSGSNYVPFAIIDQNRDGMVGTGDITDLVGNGVVAISGATTRNFNMPAANTASVTTQHIRLVSTAGESDQYALSFNIATSVYLPWRVSLLSGPNVLTPMDIGECSNCGFEPFNFWFNLGSTMPKTGDTYTLQIMDPNTEGGTFQNANAAVSGVLNAFPSNLLPGAGAGSGITPTFSWTPPPNAASYTYVFTLYDSSGDILWQIPAANAQAYGFSSAITSITWGVDPTGVANPPSISSLTPGESYTWSVQVEDSNGNTAESPIVFQP